MSRAIPGPLASHIAATESFLAKCLMLEARDGTRAGFTENVDPVTLDLGLGAGAETFGAGMEISALTLAVGLDASFAEITGPFDGPLTKAAVQGGRWNGARGWLVQVSPGIAGFAPLLAGRVAQAKAEGDAFVIELRNQADALNEPQGRVLTPYCDADLGDARCGFALPSVAAVVTAVTDTMRFSVSFSGSFANDYFNLGSAEFLTGSLAGISPGEIFDWTSAGVGAGVVQMFLPLPELPEVGATLALKQGCPKTVLACRDLFANAINFRGFPSVPGTEQIQKATVPSA